MVFKGEESELEAWLAAQKRAKGDVSAWIDMVGVDMLDVRWIKVYSGL